MFDLGCISMWGTRIRGDRPGFRFRVSDEVCRQKSPRYLYRRQPEAVSGKPGRAGKDDGNCRPASLMRSRPQNASPGTISLSSCAGSCAGASCACAWQSCDVCVCDRRAYRLPVRLRPARPFGNEARTPKIRSSPALGNQFLKSLCAVSLKKHYNSGVRGIFGAIRHSPWVTYSIIPYFPLIGTHTTRSPLGCRDQPPFPWQVHHTK